MKAFTIAIALLASYAVALADGLRTQVNASMKTITAAMKKKDFATLSKQMKAGSTADFKYVEDGRTQTLDEMLEGMKMGLGMMQKLTACNVKLLKLQEHGKTAVGSMEHNMVGTMMGQDKKTHTMSFTGVSEHTYVNVGGKWKMSSMTWKSQKQTMDGKPVTGMGH
jgi:hypothetical protein